MTRGSIHISETADANGMKLAGHEVESFRKLLSKSERCGATNSRDITIWISCAEPNAFEPQWKIALRVMCVQTRVARERERVESWNLVCTCMRTCRRRVPSLREISEGVWNPKAFECSHVLSKKNTWDKSQSFYCIIIQKIGSVLYDTLHLRGTE